MSSSDPSRDALKELWGQQLKHAKLRVDFARSHLKEVFHDFPWSEMTPDGHFAFNKALKAENRALTEYNLVLRIYANLTLYGILPNEDEWLRAQAATATESESGL